LAESFKIWSSRYGEKNGGGIATTAIVDGDDGVED